MSKGVKQRLLVTIIANGGRGKAEFVSERSYLHSRAVTSSSFSVPLKLSCLLPLAVPVGRASYFTMYGKIRRSLVKNKDLMSKSGHSETIK